MYIDIDRSVPRLLWNVQRKILILYDSVWWPNKCLNENYFSEIKIPPLPHHIVQVGQTPMIIDNI